MGTRTLSVRLWKKHIPLDAVLTVPENIDDEEISAILDGLNEYNPEMPAKDILSLACRTRDWSWTRHTPAITMYLDTKGEN